MPESSKTGIPDDVRHVPVECAKVKAGKKACLKITCDFTDGKDKAYFFYKENGKWKEIGNPLKMVFKLSHFTGYRFALSYYSSRLAGGIADFSGFQTGQEVYGDEKNK